MVFPFPDNAMRSIFKRRLAGCCVSRKVPERYVVKYSDVVISRITVNYLECLVAIGQTANDTGTGGNQYHQIMRQKVLYLLALWAVIYVGVEVTIGGM